MSNDANANHLENRNYSHQLKGHSMKLMTSCKSNHVTFPNNDVMIRFVITHRLTGQSLHLYSVTLCQLQDYISAILG